jgi:3-oxoacyl-[acyl-carrier protein] reductase
MGRRAKAYLCDVSDFGKTRELVANVLSDFGKIDILVNNAGIIKDALVLSMTEKDFDSVIGINLKGAFNMIKHVYPHFARQKGGRIINISSVSGIGGNAGQANYAAAKAGLLGLTKTVARELAGKGVTCNAIAPGFIETDMTKGLPEKVRKWFWPKSP